MLTSRTHGAEGRPAASREATAATCCASSAVGTTTSPSGATPALPPAAAGRELLQHRQDEQQCLPAPRLGHHQDVRLVVPQRQGQRVRLHLVRRVGCMGRPQNEPELGAQPAPQPDQARPAPEPEAEAPPGRRGQLHGGRQHRLHCTLAAPALSPIDAWSDAPSRRAIRRGGAAYVTVAAGPARQQPQPLSSGPR